MLPTSGSNLLRSDRQHWQPQSCLTSLLLLHTDPLFFFTLFHAQLLPLWASRQQGLTTTVSRHTAAPSVTVRLAPTWISCQFLHNLSPFLYIYLVLFIFVSGPFFGPFLAHLQNAFWDSENGMLKIPGWVFLHVYKETQVIGLECLRVFFFLLVLISVQDVFH